MVVSNAGPLIHLAKIGKLNLLKELFHQVSIPDAVKKEVVDRGKEEGMPDSFLIENEINKGWIAVQKDINDRIKEIAEKVGIEVGEAVAIMLAREKKYPILLDDLAARRFAAGLGLKVIGSVGVLIKAVQTQKISKKDALDALDRLAKVMWLNIEVYEDVRKIIEKI